MAWSARCLMQLNLRVLSNKVIRHSIQNQTRTLFTKESLGIPSFESRKQAYKEKFFNLEDTFREKMQRYVTEDRKNIIFTEDLKAMVHLVNKTPEDLDLMLKMLKKFNSQNSNMRFGSYNFGPVVMRVLHTLNEPELALQIYNDPEMVDFFDQVTSYQILLDLLYCNKKYKEMRAVYDVTKQKIPDGKVHPRNAVILATAACYKENTPESYEWALNLWKELNARGYPNIRRVTTHFAALALRQGQAEVALELLANVKKPNYISIRCLKVMAYVHLDRLDDIIPYFRSVFEYDSPNQRKETFFKDAIELVEEAIEKKNLDPEDELVKLMKFVRNCGHVQDMTLEDHIDTEITVVPPVRMQSGQYGNYIRPEEESAGPKYFRKPGLRDYV